MPRAKQPLSLTELSNRSALLPVLWWEMYWAATETIAYRLQAIGAAGLAPDARQRKENLRMVTEKLDALWDTWWACLLPDLKAPMALGQAMWETASAASGPFTAVGAAQRYPLLLWQAALLPAGQATAALETAVAPWHRRVRANAKRLRSRTAR